MKKLVSLGVVLIIFGALSFFVFNDRTYVVDETIKNPILPKSRIVDKAEFFAATGAKIELGQNVFEKAMGAVSKNAYGWDKWFRYVEPQIFTVLGRDQDPITFIDTENLDIYQAVVSEEDKVVIFTYKRGLVWGRVKKASYDQDQGAFVCQVEKFSMVNEWLGLLQATSGILVIWWSCKMQDDHQKEFSRLRGEFRRRLTQVRQADHQACVR